MEFFKIKDGQIIVSLNPKLYDVEAIYSAAYQIIDDAFVYFEGDPDEEVIVHISHKDMTKNKIDSALQMLAKSFLNNLVNYTFYKINSKKKELLRALLLKKSFDIINLDDSEAVCKPSTVGEVSEDNFSFESEKKSKKEEKTDFFEEINAFSEDDLKEDANVNNFEFEDSDSDFALKANATEFKKTNKNPDFDFEDPDGISVPWENKYGNED